MTEGDGYVQFSDVEKKETEKVNLGHVLCYWELK